MNSLVGVVLLIAAVAMVAWVAFASAGALARRSPGTRQVVLIANAFVAVLGFVVGLWLPMRIPETSGSPAGLVAIVLLWMVGGGLAFLGGAAFLGALLSRPQGPAGGDIGQN